MAHRLSPRNEKCRAYGDDVMSVQHALKWSRGFGNGRKDIHVHIKNECDRSTIVKLILENRRVTWETVNSTVTGKGKWKRRFVNGCEWKSPVSTVTEFQFSWQDTTNAPLCSGNTTKVNGPEVPQEHSVWILYQNLTMSVL